MKGRTTRCIECGGLVDSLNEDEEGEPCNACADRLLDTLPGVFHLPWSEATAGDVETVSGDEVGAAEEGERALGPPEDVALDDPDQPA